MKNQWSLGDLSNQQVESNLSLTLLIEKIQQSLDSGVSEQDIVIWQPDEDGNATKMFLKLKMRFRS